MVINFTLTYTYDADAWHSEPHSLCYIETANLDGETNLKIRQALPTTAKLLSVSALGHLQGTLHCELPNRHLYEFTGTLRLTNHEPLALGIAAELLICDRFFYIYP